MTTATYYGGGWVQDRPATTGASKALVLAVSWLATVGSAVANVGTGGEISIECLQRAHTHQVPHMEPAAEIAEAHEDAPYRTPSENLARIRQVLKPAVSDLATTFGVSRQSVYNWLNGEPVASENAEKLQDLALAADLIANEGLEVNTALLKRRFANGRTLLQQAQAGESAQEAALKLIQVYKREGTQRERMAARFANRSKTPATPDFDLPLANNPV